MQYNGLKYQLHPTMHKDKKAPTGVKDIHFWHLFEEEQTWQLSSKIKTVDKEVGEIRGKFLAQTEWPSLEYGSLAEGNHFYSLPALSTQVGRHQALLLGGGSSYIPSAKHEYKDPSIILLGESNKRISATVKSIEGVIPDSDKCLKDRRQSLQLGAEEKFNFKQLEFFGIKFDISLRRRCVKTDHASGGLADLEWQSSLCIESAKPLHLEKAIQVFRVLENLFNFIFLYSRHNYSFTASNNEGEIIYIFQKPSLLEMRPPEMRANPPLRNYTADAFNLLLSEWFGNYFRWRSIIENVVIARLGTITPSNRFVLLVSTLEMIHSESLYTEPSPNNKAAHKRMVEGFLKCAETKEQEKFIKEKLLPMHPKLFDVFKAIFDRQAKHFADQPPHTIRPSLNDDEVIRGLVRTRNYYIHGARIEDPLPVYKLNNINNSLLKYAVLSLLEALTKSDEGLSEETQNNTLAISRDEYENLYSLRQAGN